MEKITPKDVSKLSKKKYYFNCDVCDKSFKESPYNITQLNKWCPFCYLKKTEADLLEEKLNKTKKN